MSNFALDTSSSQGDLVSSLNYALANLGTFDANAVANIATIVVENILSNANIISNVLSNANVVTANTTTGALSSVHTGTINYLYNYVNVKYANSATGGSGFSSNSANKSYYGVHNTKDGSISNNPVDYQWFQVVGGFGTTRGLYHTTAGGGLVYFEPSTISPSIYYTPVVDDTPIALQSLANSIVVTNTINPGAVTNVGIATQTITTNNMAFGIITADLLAANLIIAKDIVSTNANLGNVSSAGYWLQANSGSARFGGNVSIGNNLTIGSNATVGNNISIGNNLTIGNNAVIGGNLTVAGLITGANLNVNTVSTTNIKQNAVTLTSGFTFVPASYVINNPPVTFIGAYDGYYWYSTSGNLILNGEIGFLAGQANVTTIISGALDVSGYATSSVPWVSTIQGTIVRVEADFSGNTLVTPVAATNTSSPVIQTYAAGTTYPAQQQLLPARISSISVVDQFPTAFGSGEIVAYVWVFLTQVGVFSNVIPTVGNITLSQSTLTATNYLR